VLPLPGLGSFELSTQRCALGYPESSRVAGLGYRLGPAWLVLRQHLLPLREIHITGTGDRLHWQRRTNPYTGGL